MILLFVCTNLSVVQTRNTTSIVLVHHPRSQINHLPFLQNRSSSSSMTIIYKRTLSEKMRVISHFFFSNSLDMTDYKLYEIYSKANDIKGDKNNQKYYSRK